MGDATRYPLAWPFGWKRTLASKRQEPTFGETKRSGGPLVNGAATTIKKWQPVSMPTARNRLWAQIEALGVTYDSAVLSTNVELTIHGDPRSGRRDPDDPGVALYFQLHGKDRVLACDRWNSVPGNIAAIANHIDAIRRVDRYGVGTLDQAFAGYDALPPPGAANRPPWRKVFGYTGDATVTGSMIAARYRDLARQFHPDLQGGSHDAMAMLNEARDMALREIGQ